MELPIDIIIRVDAKKENNSGEYTFQCKALGELVRCGECNRHEERGEAEQDDWRNNEHMFFGTGWIGCRKCRCFINYTGKDRGKEEAIAAWNRRASDDI